MYFWTELGELGGFKMVTRLGDFEFFPEPSKISIKATKLIGSSALIGEEKDAFYTMGAKAREITLEGWIVEEKARGLGLNRTLEEQISALRDILAAGNTVTFVSDLTGSIEVAVVEVSFQNLRGQLDRTYRIRLLEYRSPVE
jgi:hypothetical protein